MRPCDEYAALLDAYVDGELSPEEMMRVQAHLDSCPGCQAYVDDALAIRAAFPDVEETEVPDGFAESVSAAIRAGAAPQRKRRTPWAKVLAPLAACCAVVVLLAGLPAFGGDSARIASDTSEQETMETCTDPADEANQDSADAEIETDQEYAAQAETSTPSAEREALAPVPAVQPYTAAPKTETDTATQDPNAAVDGEDPAPEEEPTETEDSTEPSVNPSGVEPEETEAPEEPDAWVEYDNVVFAAVVCLPQDVVGDALTDYAGKPYSNVNHPEDGVIGTGYAMTAEEAEHILRDILEVSDALTQNPDATTDLVCIVVTEGETPASTPAE